jgi:hydrogenase maturation protein HypF
VILRIRIAVRGAVQGVGFRPFVYRLASELRLAGWVCNSPLGVFIEAEGEKSLLDRFVMRLEREKPVHARIQSLEFSFLDPLGFAGFEIRASSGEGDAAALVLPDIATCAECLREIFDPGERRYRYPFTNCTHCGPRFSIIERLPYDRGNTSMKAFRMCERCRREYEDPADRRFHAQPIACPACGPQLELWDGDGRVVARRDEALLATAAAIRAGKIAAVKGLGGFHLIADARNDDAVVRLRARKRREEKPLALMFPDVAAVRRACEVSELEERLLRAPEAPIVLLQRRDHAGGAAAAPAVAPGNPCLGVMLPYTPLHHLLMRELGFPVVATSGNLSDEPICIDEHEALERLRSIADLYLVHDRPIVRHVDDSVVRVVLGRELMLRRARGYAPLPWNLGKALPAVLAVGGHLKNAVAWTRGGNVFLSQHIGDLESGEAFAAFRRVIDDLVRLHDVRPAHVAVDMHPDYISAKYARSLGLPLLAVQHHHAHVAACAAENELSGRVLGVSWDGTGYGPDGTIWGGEFLLADENSFRRIAHWRCFRLPGGERAVKEPRRAAVGLLYEMLGERAFEPPLPAPLAACTAAERMLFRRMLAGAIHAPLTSSAGRLFDAVASLAGIRQTNAYEGQAAMELEFAVPRDPPADCYPFRIAGPGPGGEAAGAWVLDWEPMMRDILRDLQRGTSPGIVAARFHNTLAAAIVEVARLAGEERVVLSGGCFQNSYLTRRAVECLEAAGFRPYRHQRIPPNDGGIAVGQACVAAAALEKG